MAQIKLDEVNKPKQALYLLARGIGGQGLEILIEAMDGLQTKVRYIERQDFIKVFEVANSLL